MQTDLFHYSIRYPIRITCLLPKAKELKQNFGGWIVEHENKLVYWYSNQWTQSQITKDLKGQLNIY